MRAWEVMPGSKSLNGLRLAERPDPIPGPGQVVMKVRAVSLNYRDLAIVRDQYREPVMRPVIPVSDGAGEVIAIGPGVRSHKVGDRVVGLFWQPEPPMALGLPLDGMLCEQIAIDKSGVLPLPAGYSFAEAACLPCAGLTAWNSLFGPASGHPVRPGETVLVLGSGGVSIWGLLFAKAAGCRVIATTSSEVKAQRLRELGAWQVIDHKKHEKWDEEVLLCTGGIRRNGAEGRTMIIGGGVDRVLDTVGSGTIQRSINSLCIGGRVNIIGVMSQGVSDAASIAMKRGSTHGVIVGDPVQFEQMIRAVEINAIKPIIDRVHRLENAIDAFRQLEFGDFIGKVVIEM